MAQCNISNKGADWHHVCPAVLHWERHNYLISPMLYPVKMFNLNLIVMKQLDVSKLREILQINWPEFLKIISFMKKKSLGTYSRI